MKQLAIWTLQAHVNRAGPEGIRQLQERYGDHLMVQIPIVGRVNLLLHPQYAHAVLVTQHKKFVKPRFLRRTLKSSFGAGLFTAEGDHWKRQRALIQPTFHHGRIQIFAEKMLKHIQQMADHEWADGLQREISTEMHHLTFRIVLDTLFSADASSSEDTIAVAMGLLGQGLTAQASNPLLGLMPDWTPLPVFWRKRKGSQALQVAVQQLVDERRQLGEEKSPPDLLSALVFSRDTETGAMMDDDQIRDELVTLYIAGHETTALLVAWAWVLLSQNPAAEHALHAELDAVLGGRPPVLSDLPQLPILYGVTHETLRLYPPAWFLMREAIERVDVGDVSLDAGEIVMIIPYANGRDGRFFDQPEAFLPERWSLEFERQIPKGAFIPFGLGPRVCIGNGFATMEAQLILAGLAQKFRVAIHGSPQMNKTAPTLSFSTPVQATLHRR